MGFAIPVAISVLSDIVLPEERSGLFGFLAIFLLLVMALVKAYLHF